jgi:hypothetical protein
LPLGKRSHANSQQSDLIGRLLTLTFRVLRDCAFTHHIGERAPLLRHLSDGTVKQHVHNIFLKLRTAKSHVLSCRSNVERARGKRDAGRGARTKTAKPQAQLEKHRGSAWTKRSWSVTSLLAAISSNRAFGRIRSMRFLTSIKEPQR